MSKPYLVTKLAGICMIAQTQKPIWLTSSQYMVNIINVGATDAQNCSLIIKFYNSEKLLQTSKSFLLV